MKRFLLLAACAVVALTVVLPSVALARVNGVTIHNHTDKCAWITVYSSEPMQAGWDIVNYGPGNQPQFLRGGNAKTFMLANHAEVKIRAEVMSGPDCGGGKIADTYDIRKDGDSGGKFFEAGLYKTNSPGGYNLWFK